MVNVYTEVRHSESKDAWNVVGTEWGRKFKIARVPYVVCEDEALTTMHKHEALEHAQFISRCFNEERRRKGCF
jgi:hypothetical protein